MLKSERKALRYMLMGETPMPPVRTKSLPAKGRWYNIFFHLPAALRGLGCLASSAVANVCPACG